MFFCKQKVEMFVSRWTISDMKDDVVAAFAKRLFTQMFEVCKPLCVRMFVSLKFNLEKKLRQLLHVIRFVYFPLVKLIQIKLLSREKGYYLPLSVLQFLKTVCIFGTAISSLAEFWNNESFLFFIKFRKGLTPVAPAKKAGFEN